jgi:hypothetical protein
LENFFSYGGSLAHQIFLRNDGLGLILVSEARKLLFWSHELLLGPQKSQNVLNYSDSRIGKHKIEPFRKLHTEVAFFSKNFKFWNVTSEILQRNTISEVTY